MVGDLPDDPTGECSTEPLALRAAALALRAVAGFLIGTIAGSMLLLVRALRVIVAVVAGHGVVLAANDWYMMSLYAHQP